MTRDGSTYNLKVVFDKYTNTVLHFHYSVKAMGPLEKVVKN